MESKKYMKIVDKHIPVETKGKNLFVSFVVGGFLGFLGNLLIDVYSYYFHLPTEEAGIWMLMTFIFVACFLTGVGVFDNLVKKGKMGFIIPITGFAHSMQSAILDYKKEGPVYGFGSNVFKLAGSVILYGVVSAWIFGMIRFIFFGG